MSPLQLLFVACWLGLAMTRSAPPIDLGEVESHFDRFIQEYGRQYADDNEKQARFKIFKDNLRKINEKNERSNSAIFGITKFSDLTREEFLSKHTGLRPDWEQNTHITFTDKDIQYAGAPDSFDWRDRNVVTPVKDQGYCGSCYAFSATANIESQYALKYKKQLQISEQQIVDCDPYDGGCSGGFPWNVFMSLIYINGSMSQEDYPYMQYKNEKCLFDASKVKVQVADYKTYILRSQEQVKQLLYQNGPLSIGVDGEGVQHYHGGVLKDDDCLGRITHAVLLVGYGTDADTGEKYWLVKNSWGKWGDNGYFRMHREVGSVSCGMLTFPLATAVLA